MYSTRDRFNSVTDEPLLRVKDLRVVLGASDDRPIVDGVSFDLQRGQSLGLIGESGSGKTTVALSIMQILGPQVRVASGHVTFMGTDLTSLSARAMRTLRGSRIAMIFQNPRDRFDPLRPVSHQLVEVLMTQKICESRRAAKIRAMELLNEVQITDNTRVMHAYPSEISGGMLQRVMIAMALAAQPDILIADEPTSALDATIQADVLDLLVNLRREHDMSLIFITHDIDVARRMTDVTAVMYSGHIVEAGPTADVLERPQHSYTKALLEAATLRSIHPTRDLTIHGSIDEQALPAVDHRFSRRFKKGRPPSKASAGDVEVPDGKSGGAILTVREEESPETSSGRSLLTARNITKTYSTRGAGRHGLVRAVDCVDLDIPAGRILGLVGESGSGKTTLGRILLQLVRPDHGELTFDGIRYDQLSERDLRRFRPKMQIIFQNPYGSLNPRLTVRQTVEFNLRALEISGDERRARTQEAIQSVGLASEILDRYPYELSGGQAQRVGFARAIITRPRFIVADEVVSALDASVQAEILKLLLTLRTEYKLTTVFISHNLDVIRKVSDDVAVMYNGRIVEYGSTPQVFGGARHPYTRLLLASSAGTRRQLAVADRERERAALRGDLAAFSSKGRLVEIAEGHRVELPPTPPSD